MSSAPVLILGGTFDPVHDGHLHIASFLNQWLLPESVLMIPSARPPHRAPPRAEFRHRLAMLQLALEARNERNIVADDREFKRAGPSWSIDTVSELRVEFGPERCLCLCLGSDALSSFHKWRHAPKILAQVNLVTFERPGCHEIEAAAWRMGRRVDDPAALAATPSGALTLAPLPPLARASSDIRMKLADGVGEVGVPAPVMAYIEEHSLYR